MKAILRLNMTRVLSSLKHHAGHDAELGGTHCLALFNFLHALSLASSLLIQLALFLSLLPLLLLFLLPQPILFLLHDPKNIKHGGISCFRS